MSSQKAYLIIDIGTGNVRVAVATPAGQILSVESADAVYKKDYNYPESIFFEPDLLWSQIAQLTRAALAKSESVEIIAITATSQREGIVAIGNAGESLIGMPNIDHRGREWEDIIENKHEVYNLTGRFPTSLFSALKLVGLRNRLPDLWGKLKTFVSISDWAQYKLSGVLGYEHSQASETLLYDVSAGGWSEKLCKIFELNPEILPHLKLSGTVLGMILPEVAEELAVSRSAQVVVGGADTQLAIMSLQPSVDDVVIVSGTTTPVMKIANSFITDRQERTWTGRHTEDHGFLLEANAGVTGLNYQRLKEIFYPNESYEQIEQELNEISESQCLAALGSLLADEKTPLIRGGFVFNTPVSHLLTRGHFVFATLWDIACSIFENYKTLCDVTPHHKDYIWACGGGIQSAILRHFIADLSGKKVKIRDNYRQATVVGGVFACNKALNVPISLQQNSQTVFPDKSDNTMILYNDWKNTRACLKTAL